MIQATLRTNFYRAGPVDGAPATIAFKLRSKEIDGLPLPHPFAEIFVHSPRVEGVHLRGGPIARGGLRWSDRAQDFRTEVLGLAKAQQVKNAVIIPQGAKGGFYPRRIPANPDREARMAEGVACYKLFISSLLSVTDNLDAQDRIVPPQRVVRRDGDDAYLVVAADKGTATFSDTPTRSRRKMASGSMMLSPRAARQATTTSRWALPRAGPGKRSNATSAR